MNWILIFFLITTPSWALTENQIRESVRTRFPLIEAAMLKWQAAEADYTASKGAFDHQLKFKSRNLIEDEYENDFFQTSLERTLPYYGIGLIAGHRQGTGNFPAYDGKLETSSAGEIFAGISLPLLQNLSTDQVRSNLEIGKLQKLQAGVQLELKRNIYVHKALILYFKFLLEKKKYSIKKAVLELAENRNQMVKAKFKSGDIAKLKLTENERSIRKRKADLLKSEITLNGLTAQLNLYVPEFSPSLDHVQLDSMQISKPTLPKAIDFSTLPQTQILELERKKAAVLERLYRQSRLPSLNVEVLGHKELSQNDPYDPEALQIGIKFNYPLENRKATGKTVSQAYKTGALVKQQEYAVRELSRSYHYSNRALSLSLERWENLVKEVENTKTMANAEKKLWEQGSSDLYLVNLREEDVADAEIRRWTTFFEFKQHLLDAKLYLGTI